jgi:hypothetical protein
LLPPVATTQGTTLVRIGEVIEVRDLERANTSDTGLDSTVADYPAAGRVTSLAVRFADNQVRYYAVEPDAGLSIGSRVRVSENRGKISIVRE